MPFWHRARDLGRNNRKPEWLLEQRQFLKEFTQFGTRCVADRLPATASPADYNGLLI
jgi:hypothetical protein